MDEKNAQQRQGQQDMQHHRDAKGDPSKSSPTPDGEMSSVEDDNRKDKSDRNH